MIELWATFAAWFFLGFFVAVFLVRAAVNPSLRKLKELERRIAGDIRGGEPGPTAEELAIRSSYRRMLENQARLGGRNGNTNAVQPVCTGQNDGGLTQQHAAANANHYQFRNDAALANALAAAAIGKKPK